MPSISAEQYRKHAEQGTLSQLVEDLENENAGGDGAPKSGGRAEASPPPDADSEPSMGLTKTGHFRKVLEKRFPVNPVGKPRQTRSDKWKERDCVVKYREFANEIRYAAGEWSVPEAGMHIVFYVEAPKTKQERAGDPHHLKPDVDNLLKAFFDALEDEDKYIWDVRATARWCKQGDGHIDVYSIHEIDSLDT